MKNHRLLILPDASHMGSSGGTVTQTIISFVKKSEYECVCVLCSDIEEESFVDDVFYVPDLHYSGSTNYFPQRYANLFDRVVKKYRPTHVFFVGSITNKPLCYLQKALNLHLKVGVFIFMQDFYCAKIYANDNYGPCRKCLDNGLLYSLIGKCGAKKLGMIRLLDRALTRKRLQCLLRKVNYLGTSTEEQINFYKEFGVDEKHLFKLPLPFDCSKTKDLNVSRGDYFLGIAQNRIEKGFQFIPAILEHTGAKLVLAYYNEKEREKAQNDSLFSKFIKSGQLSLVVASWNSGLGELIANSQGIVIPSIWPTTTEYGFLEALSFGKPVIAFNISAHKEFLSDKINGYLSPIGDWERFGHNMDEINVLSDAHYSQLCNNVKLLYKGLTNYGGWIEYFKNF